MKVGKQEKVKQTAAKAKEVEKTPRSKEKDAKEAAAAAKHEQKGKHPEEEAADSKRITGKKQMQWD